MVFYSNKEKSLKLSWRIENKKAECGKELQEGLGEILRKFSITVSKSSQNLWFASKLQNLSIRSLNA